MLHEKVTGSCSGRLGYIIAVLDIKNVGRGKIVGGSAEFKIDYQAIVYRPFRGEVVDGVVASVNKVSQLLNFNSIFHFLIYHLRFRWVYLRMLVHCRVLYQHMYLLSFLL